MHYMKWTRVTLPVVFEKFEVIRCFDTFFFSLSLSIDKRSIFPKIRGRLQPALPPAPLPAIVMHSFYFEIDI